MPQEQDLCKARSDHVLVRAFWIALGLFCVLLGIIGAFLPIMPTTIFLILAAGCFARSSPRLEAWLLDHRYLGPSVRAWRETGAIKPGAKAMAVISMAIGYGIFWFTSRPAPLVAVLVALLVASFAAFVISRPNGLKP